MEALNHQAPNVTDLAPIHPRKTIADLVRSHFVANDPIGKLARRAARQAVAKVLKDRRRR